MRSLPARGLLALLGLLLGGRSWASAGMAPFTIQHEGTVWALAFSPDGAVLASGGEDRVVRLTETATGKERLRLEGHKGRIAALAFSPNGKILASGSRDSTICLWDTTTGRRLRCCTGHERTVLAVAFSPDGRHLASTSYDGTFRLWNVATGRVTCQTDAHVGAASALAFSPDGTTVATGGYDHVVCIWSVARDRASVRRCQQFAAGKRSEITGVVFTSGGRFVVAGGADGRLQNWDVVRNEPAESLRNRGSPVLALAGSTDGQALAVGGLDAEVELYEAASGRRIYGFGGPAGNYLDLKFSPTTGYPGEIRAVAVAPGGLTFAAAGKTGQVILWDVPALLTRKAPPPEKLDRKELEKLWDALGDTEPAGGYRALGILASHPEAALPFLKERLEPAVVPDPKQVALLIADLDSQRFVVREKASRELEKMVEAAEPMLRAALENGPSLELRRRVERLLTPLEQRPLPASRLRARRALLTAERIGTAGARALVERLTRGNPRAWLTHEARRVLARMAARVSR
jgi:WD domain, G-beta repeat